MVSWEKSNYAVGYVAYFNGQNGHDSSCVGDNADTYCTASGLMCGTMYNIWVKALGQQYNSSDSVVVNLASGEDTLTQLSIVGIHIHLIHSNIT